MSFIGRTEKNSSGEMGPTAWKSVKSLPPQDRPREKLLTRGPDCLSDAELLVILLGSGTRGKNVFAVAHTVLRQLEGTGKLPDAEALTAISGIGTAKACQILAALEFSRRRFSRKVPVVRGAGDALPFVAHIADRKQEHFLCLSVNGANEVIASRIVTVGLLNSTQVHPREVFADAISERAASVILAHNHPSGVLTPSSEDRAITRQLQEAGNILGIPVLDHLIVSREGYFSFQEAGML